MEFNTDKNLFLGINKDNELIVLELNCNDMNKETYYYISCSGYRDIKDEETGEQEAREVLKYSDYWDDLGMIDRKSFLTDYINFDDVAEHVLNTDGWYNTNGEYYNIGFYEDKNYYINLGFIGYEKENLKRENLKTLYINEEDLKFIKKSGRTDIKNKKTIEELKKIFSKYQDTKPIIKDFLEVQE